MPPSPEAQASASSPPERPSIRGHGARITAAVVLAIIVVVLLAQTYARAGRASGNDLTSYLLSASALLETGNPYETTSPFPYLYPALLACLLVPLTFLPAALAVLIWFVLGVTALYVAVRKVVRAGTGRWDAGLIVPSTICFVMLLSPIQNTLLNGQVNLVVLLLCVLFATQLAAGRPGIAAFLLALAMAIKLIPAVFLFHLVLRRRLGVASLALAWFAVMCVAPVVLAGPGVLADQWSHAASLLETTVDPPGFPGDYPPFSLAGVIAEWLPALRGPGLVAAAALIVLATVGWVDRRTARRSDAARTVEVAQLYLVAMLLISPLSEKHHLVLLAPAAILTTLDRAVLRRDLADPGLVLVGLFWAGLIVGGWTSLPLHFLAITALLAALATVLERPRVSHAPRTGATIPGAYLS